MTFPAAASEAEFVIGEAIAVPEGEVDSSKPVIRMLVTQFARPNLHYPLVFSTTATLQKLFGKGNVEVRGYSGETGDIENADLVLSSAGTYVRMLGRCAKDLATAASDLTPNPNRAEGSLFITLDTRNDIRTFDDMKGKRVTATGPNAFSGYHAALGEIARRGEDPDKFFGSFVRSGHDMTRELDLLRAGEADVAVVRTCLLEELKAQGADIADIRPLALREGIHPAGCMTSTDLYPNWTIFATPSLSPENARLITQALLSMPKAENGVHWSVASDFTTTDRLYKAIRLGPYAYLRTWTWERFWDEYRTWIIALLIAIAGLAAHAYRTARLVDLRTAQLRQALIDQQTADARAKAATERMQTLQKAGAVGQISSIIAHELRQPLSAIIGYAQGISRLLDTGSKPDKTMIETGISAIRSEAERAESIVEKVRSYARGKKPARQILDVSAICRQCAETVTQARIAEVPVLTELPPELLKVCADPLELELCLHNLLKNAMRSASSQKSPRVLLTTRRRTDEKGRARIDIGIRDNGQALTDEEFAGLNRVLESTRSEGLGLGLAIVRLIAENHGGRLSFERLSPHGLCARLTLPEAEHDD
ncbi:MAG: PhnD/SsuA/transferrin family substrate-binding protein [Sutterella sp.]